MTILEKLFYHLDVAKSSSRERMRSTSCSWPFFADSYQKKIKIINKIAKMGIHVKNID